jgi:hypothetical protein
MNKMIMSLGWVKDLLRSVTPRTSLVRPTMCDKDLTLDKKLPRRNELQKSSDEKTDVSDHASLGYQSLPVLIYKDQMQNIRVQDGHSFK